MRVECGAPEIVTQSCLVNDLGIGSRHRSFREAGVGFLQCREITLWIIPVAPFTNMFNFNPSMDK